jgi:AraC family transcriptional activator of pobA
MIKKPTIPLNTFPDVFSPGMAIAKTSFKDLDSDILGEAHRDDYHLFFMLEEGQGVLEIDFQQYIMESRSAMYIQPYQVHKGISTEGGVFTVLIISSDNIREEYLNYLKNVVPGPVRLNEDTFSILTDISSLCINMQERTDEKLYSLLLKDNCNLIIGLLTSQYLVKTSQLEATTRFETVTRLFMTLLDEDFVRMKRPGEYAEKLKLSTVYLNECVKKTTGQSISYHIHQRLILEAKRLLYHTAKSVKEISADLGFNDYAYFSRLFKKVAGITAIGFRNKNSD